MTIATDAAWPDSLKGYYQRYATLNDLCSNSNRFFPSSDFCRWLSYGTVGTSSSNQRSQNDFLFRREFSFTLPGDIYCRYLSFKTAEEFKTALENSLPDKIDIGAVFTIAPKHYKEYNVIGPSGASAGGNSFRPLERELVFDIDMDEYDDVRTCCKGAQVCQKCWTFIAAAVRCINETLRQDFGFKHIMFVFSGRRGVHCWVCDETARKLSNEQRSALAEYMQLIAGPKTSGMRASATLRRRGMQQYPLVKRSVEICQEYFEKPVVGILEGQNVFKCDKDASEASLESSNPNLVRIVKCLPEDSSIRQDLPTFFRLASKDPKAAWKRVVEDINAAKTKRKNLPVGTEDILLEYTYPRLDINVSKQMNHLLKAPFCVHPKTGRVCVPILDPEHPELFEPNKAPLLADVINGDREIAKYLSWFSEFVNEIVMNEGEQNQSMDF
jgi:DNA primase small subunit